MYHQLGWRPVSDRKCFFGDTWKSMDFNGNEAAASLGAQIHGKLEIHGNLLISMEIHNSWARKFDILWHLVAPCGGALDAPKKPLQAGGPQIIRSSDVGIIGWSDLGIHQWSDLRSLAVWLWCQGLAGQMLDDERNNDEKNDWKKVPHARAE